MSKDVISLARTLIDIPSVTGDEGPIARRLVEILEERGFTRVVLQPVEGDRANVACFPDDPRVVFCTHMDTVGPTERSSESDGKLYGRGAVDAKGILAAMILATESLKGRGEDRVGLLFLVGEEVDSIGAQVADRFSPHPEFLVVGEPTEAKLATAQKGGLAARIRARGVAGHSGYPEYGASAIHVLMAGLADLLERNWGVDGILGPATVNVGRIAGGVAANVLAPSASADVLIRLVGQGSDARKVFEEWHSGHPDIDVESINTADPLHFHTIPGFPAGAVSFGSDAPYLPSFGTPLMYGPGSIRQAHTQGEFIEMDALRRAPAAYERIATALLDEGSRA